MNQIILFDKSDYNGESKKFVENVPDLSELIFDNTAMSARVEGHHWIGYTKKNYKGEFIIFGTGDYRTLGPNFNHRLSSLRLVDEDLLDPEIDLYELEDYRGQHREIKEKVDDLRKADFNNLVSSDIVKRGVWILHQEFNQTGPRCITFKGDKWRSYSAYGWKDKLSSLRPLEKSVTEVGDNPSVRIQREQAP